jgi:hypothetical protein
MTRSAPASGPAPARNVRARVSSEVGWSTCMHLQHAHRTAGSAARMHRRVRRRRWLRPAGGVSAAARTAGTPCLPASACPEIRPWAGAAPKHHPGKPACRASIFINPLGLAVKLRPRRPAGRRCVDDQMERARNHRSRLSEHSIRRPRIRMRSARTSSKMLLALFVFRLRSQPR